MNYPIPHLESILLLAAIVYPVGFGSNMSAMLNHRESRSIGGGLLGMVGAYVVILVLVGFVQPERVLTFRAPRHLLYLVAAPLVGLGCILVEYLVGMLLAFLRTGKLITRMVVHKTYSGVLQIGVMDIILIIAFVVGEEYVFRQVLWGLLSDELGAPLGLVIALCTVIYALNHLTFGFQSVIPKIASGLIYVLLFYFAGLSLIIPILAHATQNLSLLALSRTRKA